MKQQHDSVDTLSIGLEAICGANNKYHIFLELESLEKMEKFCTKTHFPVWNAILHTFFLVD